MLFNIRSNTNILVYISKLILGRLTYNPNDCVPTQNPHVLDEGLVDYALPGHIQPAARFLK